MTIDSSMTPEMGDGTAETLAAVNPPRARPRVVVVGGGFGGINAARAMARGDVDVLVLDRNNYHGFWPLLYQVATAGLEPESIAYPIRAILRSLRNADFQLAQVQGVDFARKLVLTDGLPVSYDYLVLAAGSASNYFGNDALADTTFGLKDLDEAISIRNHLLTSFERAVREPDAAVRRSLLTFVVIGGGPTGVEMAGAFIELINDVMRKDYPTLDIAQARVLLVEAVPNILTPFSADLQQAAKDRLQEMGVELRLNAPVATVADDIVTLKDGTQIAAHTVVWAAGVRASKLTDTLGLETGRGARVKVTPQLHLVDRPEVFVIGDMAYLEGYKPGVAYPMVASVAIQMGKQAGANIVAHQARKPLRAFSYFDKGQMATIGRTAAVLESFGIKLTGFLAWLGWLFIHLIELVGFRNRLLVLTNWAYSYLTFDRGARLITRRERNPTTPPNVLETEGATSRS